MTTCGIHGGTLPLNSGRAPRTLAWMALLLVVVLSGLASGPSAEQRRLAIYSPSSSYTVDLLTEGGTDYAGIVDLLDPLGHLEATLAGNRLRIRFNNLSCEFQDGSREARVGSSRLDLATNFVVLNQHGYLPLASVPGLLARLTGQPAEWHATARRLFLGVQPVKPRVELQKNPSRLVLSFPGVVNPGLAVEHGLVRLTFLHEPVIAPGADSTYADPLIASLSVAETNGAAEFTIRLQAPAAARFTDSGHTIVIGAAVEQATAPPQRVRPETPPPSPDFESRPPVPGASHPRFMVVIDAAHGGDDAGDQITPKLAEKTVTLSLAHRLARELEQRGIPVTLIRTADVAIALDARANIANGSRASIYITLHASSLGRGTRIYTALLPASAAQTDRHAFAPWETAQSAWLDSSRPLAESLQRSLSTRSVETTLSAAPVAPLNHLTSAAVAVECAPSGDNPGQLASNRYQQAVAAALAEGVANLRERLEGTQ